ncbi:MAG: AAA family ATPase [Candidatus Dojkabacteria bacterium]
MEYSNNYNQANTPVVNDALDESLREVQELETKLSAAGLPERLKEEAMSSVSRLKRMFKLGGYSAEFETVSKYIDWITRIPWGVVSEDNFDIHRARKIMDESHHGMDTIKDLILDYIATMQLQSSGGVERLRKDIIPSQVQYQNNSPQGMPNKPMGQEVQMGVLRSSSANAPVFLFLGLQGVGKTSIAKSIAQSMGRKFSRISLGAIGDVRTLRGAPRYSSDAEPGQVIKSLVRCGTMNPVILLDEIEKASGNKGLLSDIMAVLLEILDPEQNSTFVDHYIDHPVDLSNVFFICTANNLGGLSAALLDRVEVIRFTSYSDQEKEVIGKEYILPRVLKNLNISPEYIKIEEEVWPLIIRPVGFDAGIRQLERNITTIVRSAARMIVEGKPLPIVINSSNLTDYVLADQGPLS